MTEHFTGFSQRWKDFPDYILGITEEIWEGRDLRSLDRSYAPDVTMRFPSGLVTGNQAVIDGTLATLAEFPDRQLLGEDVIWSGDARTGYLSSHRILSTGTHLGHGAFGRPTGRRFTIRAIADCAARADAIFDEWLIRDAGGLVRQLGHEPEDWAAAMIAREGGPARARRPFTPEDDRDGGYHGTGNEDEWGLRFAEVIEALMDKRFERIARLYDRACETGYPGVLAAHGREAPERFWMGLRSAFPEARFTIHHRIGRDDPMMPPRAALRWSLDGRHTGFGAFGTPTGASVHVMGISHAEFGPFGPEGWSVRREWTLIDEVSVWKQILMATGESA